MENVKTSINELTVGARYTAVISLLALASVVLAFVDMGDGMTPTLQTLDLMIYWGFVIEYLVRIWTAEKRRPL